MHDFSARVKNSHAEPVETCACCHHVSLPVLGNYEICPVCYWEDEGEGFGFDEPSSANHGLSLRQGNINFGEFGACEKSVLVFVVPIEERERYKPRHLEKTG